MIFVTTGSVRKFSSHLARKNPPVVDSTRKVVGLDGYGLEIVEQMPV